MIQILTIVVFYWTSLYFIHFILKNIPFISQRYENFLDRIGLTVRFFQARFFTKRYNGLLARVVSLKILPWEKWFSVGSIFSVFFMIISYIVLFYSGIKSYRSLFNESTGPALSSIIPGLKFSVSHIYIYCTTLILCAVIHETGHALAAIMENVRLNGFGLFFIGLYPGAFVDLNTNDLTMLNPLRQLRIYCAGVWHNIVIVVVSLTIYNSAPSLFSPLYFTQNGVSVSFLESNSVLTGNRGLQLGDAIYKINSCLVLNSSDWVNCLQDTHNKPGGYCLAGSYLQQQLITKSYLNYRSLKALASKTQASKISLEETMENIPYLEKFGQESDCCPIELSVTHLCFRFDKRKFHNIFSTSRTLVSSEYTSSVGKYYRLCLPARSVTERKSCSVASDCESLSGRNQTIKTSVCVIPSPKGNHTRLFRVQHNKPYKPAILFLGPVTDLYSFVGVSDYIPKWPFFFSPTFPNTVLTFCYYSFSLSGALLLINAIPCYSLDGQWILKAILEYLLPTRVKLRNYIFTLLTIFGTFLLFINVALEFVHMYQNNI